jgi:RND family efflux transporter MFP subunit
VRTQGTVGPHREIDLVAQVGGLVEQVAEELAEGSFFADGTVLVQLEPADYEIALVRAEARVAEAKQLVAQEKGRTRQAAREWRDLGNDEANALFLRKPQLQSAEAALRAARAEQRQARLNLDRTRISAPFAGRVRDKFVDAGQYVAPGTRVARVYDTEIAEVRLPLTDRQVALLDLPLNFRSDAAESAPGVKLTATFAGRTWSWDGRLVRTEATIDVETRVVYALVEVDKPFDAVPGSSRPPLSIGLFVEAEIRGRQFSELAQIPRRALRNDDSVLLVDEEDRLVVRHVEVISTGAETALVQGLAGGERVVTSQPSLAVAGMRVTPRDSELASRAR